jgi:hypothetical protein
MLASPIPSSTLVPATDKPSREPRDHPNRVPSEVESHPVTLLSARDGARDRAVRKSVRRHRSSD